MDGLSFDCSVYAAKLQYGKGPWLEKDQASYCKFQSHKLDNVTELGQKV